MSLSNSKGVTPASAVTISRTGVKHSLAVSSSGHKALGPSVHTAKGAVQAGALFAPRPVAGSTAEATPAGDSSAQALTAVLGSRGPQAKEDILRSGQSALNLPGGLGECWLLPQPRGVSREGSSQADEPVLVWPQVAQRSEGTVYRGDLTAATPSRAGQRLWDTQPGARPWFTPGYTQRAKQMPSAPYSADAEAGLLDGPAAPVTARKPTGQPTAGPRQRHGRRAAEALGSPPAQPPPCTSEEGAPKPGPPRPGSLHRPG